ncbi:radical SAM protein [Ferroplasma sp.]|uniref:radical SAM protein n=1 Tax=Ferroplasma sp. TaxID=2591003 RepID=UPI00307DCF12
MFATESGGLIKIESGERRLSMNSDSDMIYYSLEDRTYRRTNMNDFVEFRYIDGNRIARLLPESEKQLVANNFYGNVKEASLEYPFLKKHIKDYNFLKSRGNELMRIYGSRIPVVPPDRYFSLYVKISRGCPWNQCTFCELYRDQRYLPLSFDSFKEQVEKLSIFFKNSVTSMNGIFLGDANAISMGSRALNEYLFFLNSKLHMPLYAFSDAFTTPLKNIDFIKLKNAGVKRIYIGIESGNSAVLKILNKKINLKSAGEFIKKIKDAGINIGLIVMSGFGKDHVNDTVNFLKSIVYAKGDIIYISPVKEYNEFREILIENGMEKETGQKEFEYDIIRTRLKESINIPVVVYNLDEAIY